MATYTLTVNYGASNATIVTNCGTTGVYQSSSGSYWYKITSSKIYRSTTSATSGFSVLASSKTATSGSSGTSKTVYFDLTNVGTTGMSRTGYHVVGTSAWKTPGGLALNQDASSASATNAPTVYRLLDNANISANKTVTIQPNWVANSYTINYNANGGIGTTASSSHTYGTAKALTTNGFTQYGYTFDGWSKNSGTTVSIFYVRDSGPCYPSGIGTDGTYIYLRQNTTYYRITIDGSNSYTNIGTTAPSGVASWISSGSSNVITLNGQQYYFAADFNENHDWCNVYRKGTGAQTVDFTDGQSITTITKADGTAPSDGDTITLYAVWTPKTCSVDFDDNEGGDSGLGFTRRTMTYGSTTNKTVTPPGRYGYTFAGYYDDIHNGEKVYDSSGNAVAGIYWGSSWQYNPSTSSALTLYAHWTANSYSYTLNPNGGTYNNTTGVTVKSVTYGTTTNNNPGIPTRAGYRFTGWYTSASGGYKVFDESGAAVNDLIQGPWYNASPTVSLGSGAYYIHYGDYVWGLLPDGIYMWEGDAWQLFIEGSSLTPSSLRGVGNIVGIFKLAQPVVTITIGYHCNPWEDGGYTDTILIIGNTPTYTAMAGSTSLPNYGYIWLSTLNPTFYAHWVPEQIFTKNSDNWESSLVQARVASNWLPTNEVYVKSSGSWVKIWPINN